MRTLLAMCVFSLGTMSFGCGEADTPELASSDAHSSTATNSQPTLEIPGPGELAVSLGSESDSGELMSEEDGLPEPEAGTPEWSLREIAVLRGTPIVSEDEQAPVSDQEFHRREVEREKKIVSLATSVIAATHRDTERERLFNAGVHALTEARLNLAAKGDQDQIDAMYDDAASLFKRSRESVAAVTAAYGLIRLAEGYTQRIPSSDSWRDEYVKQVRLFAKSFPKEESRAVVGLTSAGQLCEDHGQLDRAAECFDLIVQLFPTNAFAAQAQATLRRLKLVGQPIDLAGPTIDGGFVSMDDLKEKTVLVMFWSASSEVFASDWKTIDAAYEKYGKQGFEIIGVNLDKSELAVDKFLEEHAVKGRHIFYLQEGKRGLANPIARYYDVATLPTYWLIDRGVVRSTTVEPEGLAPMLGQLAAAKANSSSN